MNTAKITPKDFFLWAGSVIALYASTFALIGLLFDYIDRVFPDALNTYIDPYAGSVRNEMAILIVLCPIFLVLMRMIRADIARMAEKRDLWIRRWALYLTIFIAGTVVAVDFITIINYFLGGEITARFLLKAGATLLVAGAGFTYFLLDIKGYWIAYPRRARMASWGAAAVVALTIVSGFFIIGSPSQVRTYRLDDQRVSDLTDIQYQIIDYWRQKEALPQTLADARDELSGATIPVDPETRQPYEYVVTGKSSFSLCANFGAPSQTDGADKTIPATTIYGIRGPDLAESSWRHEAGRVCFERTIDPERYPPYSKSANQ